MKTFRKIFGIILIIVPFLSTFSQSPSINVFPDSIIFLMQYPNETRVDSFGITNTGSDTLRYQVTYNQIVDTSWYNNIFIDPTLVESDSTIRATVFSPLNDFILLQVKYPLSIQMPTEVEFFLFESLSLTGNYDKVYSKEQLVDSSTFNDFIMSDYLNIRLHSGNYYAIGIAWDHLVQYKSPGSSSITSDGLQLQMFGSYLQNRKYPTDSILTISEVSYKDEMEITGGIVLWLQLLSDSSGSTAVGDTNIIKFSVQDPGFPPGSLYLTNYIMIHSNDPLDSIKQVVVSRSFVVAVDVQNYASPLAYELGQNYPNPFNPITTIKYNLLKSSEVKILVYDVLGNEIASLVNEEQTKGSYEIKFDGNELSSGVYFYRLQAGEYMATKKMLLAK